MKTEAIGSEIISSSKDNFLGKAATRLASLQRLAGSPGTRLLLVAGLVASSAPVLTGCNLFIEKPQLGLPTEVPPNTGGNGYEGPRLIPTSTIAAEALKTPTLAPTPKPTQEPPTPTPEVPKNIDCSLFSKDVCSKAEVTEWTNSSGKKMKIVGLDPDKGESLLMPKNGWQVAKVKFPDDDIFKGYEAQIYDPENPTTRIIVDGDFEPHNMFSINLPKGESFGTVQETGKKNAGRKIIIYVIEKVGDESIVSDQRLQQLFPTVKL